MPIKGFAHINVSTKDLETSRRFYSQVLGLEDLSLIHISEPTRPY